MNWVYFILSLGMGFASIIYSKWLADNVTRIEVFDKWFGRAGTFYFYKLAGVLLVLFGFYALFNF